GYFVVAMVGLIGAQMWLGRMGYRLARPERLDEAIALIRRVRAGYMLLNVLGLVFIAIGLAELLEQLDLPTWTIAKVLLTLLVNVLLLTLIGTDLVIANLARGQALVGDAAVAENLAAFQRDVSQFGELAGAPPPAQGRSMP